ncbi:MAG TPA: ATP-grasp domain-containing protein [Thermoanaerobaculaceae bacterium]|nr:ATP-grasp domain-containing protein [Thermoanaerobaculaceae bacterium]
MARLAEHKGKQVLLSAGVAVPRGALARSAAEAAAVAAEIGGAVVVKAQAWTTSRAAQGLIRFADSAEAAADAAAAILATHAGGFPVSEVLVEERVAIASERYVGVILDDRRRCPVILVSALGGSGIEETALEHPEAVFELPLDVVEGLPLHAAREAWRRVGVHGEEQRKLAESSVRLVSVARSLEARSAEINPLVVAADGRVIALDCRITVDDAAVFRHLDLGIEVARELGHPPTPLERIAWDVEKDDYRGTFYFLQMKDGFERGDRVVAFHGAGGGGSMMGMDALQRRSFSVANFCDTSGNPPASKVYRAARILLSQPGVNGYFGTGSGVASQEQFHSARGLVKAFLEEPLEVPAVVRLGGNGEEKAIEILTGFTKELGVPVECYGKDTPVDACAERLEALVGSFAPPPHRAPERRLKPAGRPYTFKTPTGAITYDHAVCRSCESKACVAACVPQILKLAEGGVPVLKVTVEEAARGRCTECLACEVDCRAHGAGGGHVELPIPGLAEYRASRGME